MNAIRRRSVLVLALLLAAATAAADTVVTIDEVIACSVGSADADSVRVRLGSQSRRPRSWRDAYHISHRAGRSRTLLTADIYEIRLSDPNRVAELAPLLPRTRVTADSGQPVPSPEARAQTIAERWAGVDTVDSIACASMIHTLGRNASPAEMVERCREMRAALLDCGRDGGEIVQLLRDVDSEERAVRGIWPRAVPCITGGACGGLGGVVGGAAVGIALDPGGGTTFWPTFELDLGMGPPCALLGCALGSGLGAAFGASRHRSIVARHRNLVNDLIRKCNRAVAEP